MKTKVWKSIDEVVVPDVLPANISPLLYKILTAKGVPVEEMEEFLNDNPRKTYDPFLMKDMDKAVDLILETIKEKKKIVIYGDYDVDGICSTSLLMEFLSDYTDSLDYYIPLRTEEGYGLNMEALIDINLNLEADLIITVDCGSTSVEEVEMAQELGMDIIITDHHNLGDVKPDCLILNPKQPDCSYPFKLICGCGVAFKLAQGIHIKTNGKNGSLAHMMDLVAMATVADVVDLVDENRTFVKYGLKNINRIKRRIGLRKLIDKIGLGEKTINTGHIGFGIAPHFNASGRVSDAKIGVKLLLEKDEELINEYVEQLVEFNSLRKDIQSKGEEQAFEQVETFFENDNFLIVELPDISEGVIGIVAGKARDRFYKPTLVVTLSSEDGVLKGSGRSIDGVDLYEEMAKNRDLFLKFGGHSKACGFSIEASKLVELRNRMNQQMEELKKNNCELYQPKLKVYAELSYLDLNEKLVSDLAKLEPFGMGNETPNFVIKDFKVNTEKTTPVGADKKHLKLCGSIGSGSVNGIGFDLADYFYNDLKCSNLLDMVCYPAVNEYMGKRSVQIQVKDMKAKQLSCF